MTPILLLTILTLIAVAAPRYGVDSRWAGPGEEVPPPRRPHTLTGDLAALARLLRAARPASPHPWATTAEVGSPAAARCSAG